jgi:hypothetical protein
MGLTYIKPIFKGPAAWADSGAGAACGGGASFSPQAAKATAAKMDSAKVLPPAGRCANKVIKQTHSMKKGEPNALA